MWKGRGRRKGRRWRWWYRDRGLLCWEWSLRFFYNRRATRGGGRERWEHLPHRDRRLWGNYDLRREREREEREHREKNV